MKSISFERDLRLQHHGSFQPSLLSLLKSEITKYPSISDDLNPILDLTLSIDYNHIGLSSSPISIIPFALHCSLSPKLLHLRSSLLLHPSFTTLRNCPRRLFVIFLLPSSVVDAINLLTVDRSNYTLEYKDYYYFRYRLNLL